MRFCLQAAVVMLIMIAIITATAHAAEDVLLMEIRALKEKVSEIDQLKLQITELQKQVTNATHRCEALEVHGTVKEIKESLI